MGIYIEGAGEIITVYLDSRKFKDHHQSNDFMELFEAMQLDSRPTPSRMWSACDKPCVASCCGALVAILVK